MPGSGGTLELPRHPAASALKGTREVFFPDAGRTLPTRVWDRYALRAGVDIEGQQASFVSIADGGVAIMIILSRDDRPGRVASGGDLDHLQRSGVEALALLAAIDRRPFDHRRPAQRAIAFAQPIKPSTGETVVERQPDFEKEHALTTQHFLGAIDFRQRVGE